MAELWKSKNFWTALKLGLVDEPEKRAVSLLSKICDPKRLGVYLSTGVMVAMGNITRRMYLIHRSSGVDELDSNWNVAFYWCIHTGFGSGIPPTDDVITIRNLIEGAEQTFRRIGNRSMARVWGGVRGSASFPPFLPKDVVAVKAERQRLEAEVHGKPKKAKIVPARALAINPPIIEMIRREEEIRRRVRAIFHTGIDPVTRQPCGRNTLPGDLAPFAPIAVPELRRLRQQAMDDHIRINHPRIWMERNVTQSYESARRELTHMYQGEINERASMHYLMMREWQQAVMIASRTPGATLPPRPAPPRPVRPPTREDVLLFMREQMEWDRHRRRRRRIHGIGEYVGMIPGVV